MPSFAGVLKEVKGQIRETDVDSVRKIVAAKRQPNGNGAAPVVIDVREKDEWMEGFIPGSRWIPRGFLEQRIEDQVPEKGAPVVLYCAGGTRSASQREPPVVVSPAVSRRSRRRKTSSGRPNATT